MKIPKWVAILLIASLFFNIKTSMDISIMKNDIRNLRSSLNSMEYSLANAVSDSFGRINDMLEKEASMVNEFEYKYLEHKNKRIDYLLTLKPKIYNEGEKLYFLLKIGENSPQLIPAETVDKVTFTAKVNMSIFDQADIDLVIEDNNSKKTQKLETIYPAIEKFATRINARPLGGQMRYDKSSSALIISYSFELVNDFKPDEDSPVLSDVNLNIEVNGKLIDTLPMTWEDISKYPRYFIELKDYSIPCKAGDIVIMYATAKDYKGFDYKCHMEGWTIKSNGGLDPAPGRYRFGEVEIF